MAQDEQDIRKPGGASDKNGRLAPTIIVGLGNPILGDDGIGWLVAQKTSDALYRRMSCP